jgi:hypothetical protein
MPSPGIVEIGLMAHTVITLASGDRLLTLHCSQVAHTG